MSHPTSSNTHYAFAMDPYCDLLAPAPPQNVATTKAKKDVLPGSKIKEVKSIAWPRPNDDKALVFEPPSTKKPIFPWDYYVCDIVAGLTTVGEIMASKRGGGITVAFPEVFDGARYGTEQLKKCQEVLANASEKLLREYTEYGRQERGEYVRFWEAVTGRQISLEWIHSTGAGEVVQCEFCELRFPGEAEKAVHERVRHRYEDHGRTVVTADSWRTPLEGPIAGSSVTMYSSVYDSMNSTNRMLG